MNPRRAIPPPLRGGARRDGVTSARKSCRMRSQCRVPARPVTNEREKWLKRLTLERALATWTPIQVAERVDESHGAPWMTGESSRRRARPGIDCDSLRRGGCHGKAFPIVKTDDSFYAKQTSADAGISAFPDGDNIFSWVGTIEGAAGTVSVTNKPRVSRERGKNEARNRSGLTSRVAFALHL
jgi:hypothetical protein